MQSRAHQFLLLLPLLVAGCSAEVELSTEARTPSETTEHVQKFETKVGVAVLSGREDPSDEKPVQSDDRSSTIDIEGNHNFAIVVEGDFHADSHQDAAPESPSESKFFWNTRIPWPTQLRGASSRTLNCYWAVWGLMIGSVALMIHTANRKEGGPLWIILAVLAAAIILIQFLPHADSGIQFVPLSPWSYIGWESFFISLACWAAILGAGYVVVDRAPDSPKAFSGLVLVALSLNAMLSFSELKENSASRPQAAACQQVEASTLPT